MLALPTSISANASFTSGAFLTKAATRLATSAVCSSVVPGVISIWIWVKSLFVSGWNVIGSVAKARIVAPNAAAPIATVFQRWISDQRSRRHVAIHHPAFAMLGLAMRLQEIGGDHRRDQAGDGQAHQHRDDHGEAEILEELAGDARHQADRQEHRDDREGGSDDGEADLVGGVDRRLIGAFAHPHMSHDILDLDDRVVDSTPATRLSASRLRLFSEKPSRSMNQKVGIADSGIASAEINVARQSRRNRNTTMTASTAPSIIDSSAE